MISRIRRRRPSHSRAASPTLRRRPRFESLERRELLAGNVTARVEGGDLVIRGDNASNEVSVSQVDATTFEVTGAAHGGSNTRVNGVSNGRIRLTGVIDDVRVYMKGGDDEVRFHGRDAQHPLTIPDCLIVYTHAGNDQVSLFNVHVKNDAVVNTGSGKDALTAEGLRVDDNMYVRESATPHYSGDSNVVNIHQNSAIGGGLDVKLNRGDDRLKIERSTASRIRIEGGAGDDEFFIEQVATKGDIWIDPGAGDDRTTIQYATVGDDIIINESKEVRSSLDHDHITIQNARVADYIIVAGNRGKETVRITGSTADELYAKLDGGDDSLNIKHTSARSWTLDGGTGDDSLNRYGNSAFFNSRNFNRYSARSEL